ncbi:MAG: cysteine dioxygenase family protein [Acidobacteriota bacterium]
MTAEDLTHWAAFDHPIEDSYGRKMLFDGGFFELMVMSWVDGDMAAIHDHGYTQWGAVKVFGPTEHAIFKLEDGFLTTAERRQFAPNSVVAVSHELIHQMGNVGQQPYLTLHLYGCYERDGCVTGDARLYELDENSIQITSGGVFYALPEDAVDERRAAPAADFPTTLRFKVELLERLLRSSGGLERGSLQCPRERRLAKELMQGATWERAGFELDRMRQRSALRFDRYVEILQQELRAAARLQAKLLRAGVIRSELAPHQHRLAELLEIEDLAVFADGYLELIGSAFSIDLLTEQAA